jgi:cell division protein FtsB
MKKTGPYIELYRPSVRRLAGPMLIVFVIFYLGFHAVSGQHGLFALFKETRKLELLKTELAKVKGEREELERKVQLLSSKALDLDMLDEQVRRILGMTGKDEIVYFEDENSPAKQ